MGRWSLVPGKVVKELSDGVIQGLRASALHYQDNMRRFRKSCAHYDRQTDFAPGRPEVGGETASVRNPAVCCLHDADPRCA